ncbi:hypothetical protein ACLMJK_009320 [Lecanora helva]
MLSLKEGGAQSRQCRERPSKFQQDGADESKKRIAPQSSHFNDDDDDSEVSSGKGKSVSAMFLEYSNGIEVCRLQSKNNNGTYKNSSLASFIPERATVEPYHSKKSLSKMNVDSGVAAKKAGI